MKTFKLVMISLFGIEACECAALSLKIHKLIVPAYLFLVLMILFMVWYRFRSEKKDETR